MMRRFPGPVLAPVGLALVAWLSSAVAPTPARAQSKAETSDGKAGKALSIPRKEKLKNNIRRLLQNSRMARARALVGKAIGEGKQHENNRDLLAFAYWAKAVLEGNRSDSVGGGNDNQKTPGEACLEFFDRAIEAGWKNPFTFQFAALIREDIRTSDEFVARVDKLLGAFEADQEKTFRARLDAGFTADAGVLPLPADLVAGEIAATVRGKPLMLVITKVHHDGFLRAVPMLKKLHAEYRDVVPTVVLFSQYSADDEHRKKLTANYVTQHGLDMPHSIVEREYTRPLEIPIYPVFLFLDGEGRLVFRQDGLIHEKFMEKFIRIALDKLKSRAAAAAEKSAAEAAARAAAQAKAEADARAKAQAKAEVDARAKAQAKAEADARAKAQAKAEADARAKAAAAEKKAVKKPEK